MKIEKIKHKTTCTKCGMSFTLGKPSGAQKPAMYTECSEPGCHRRFGEVQRAKAKRVEMFVERRRMVR